MINGGGGGLYALCIRLTVLAVFITGVPSKMELWVDILKMGVGGD